jgi:hypothetical protein
MEEFSLNNIDIEIFRPHKSPVYSKLKYLLEFMKNEEIKRKLFIFFYHLFIDCVARGNKIVYINDEVIYMHKDTKDFKYYSKYYIKIND